MRCYCCCFVRHGPHEEEEVIYERLPSDIAQRHVLLLDPLVGTGRTACRAVEVSCYGSRQGWGRAGKCELAAGRRLSMLLLDLLVGTGCTACRAVQVRWRHQALA